MSLELWGLIGLFLGSFLAATVVPFSSEALFLAMLYNEAYPVWSLLLVASVGNTLGGMSTYGLGYLGNWEKITRFTGIKSANTLKWKRYLNSYGLYTALLTWLPVVGDVLALLLGLSKANTWKVLVLMYIGKFLRFWFIYQIKASF